MKRADNWEGKLYKLIESRRNKKMVWGKTDCFTLVFDAVKVITEENIGASDLIGVKTESYVPDKPFAGEYKTARQAYGLLKKNSGKGLKETWEIIAERLGMPEKQVAYAGRGDIAVVETETEMGGVREVMGVVVDGKIVAQGKDGIVFCEMGKVKKVWSI